MQLTRILLKKIVPGHMFTGKHRVLKPVKFHHRVEMFKILAREEENSFYLTRPYLTPAQEYRSGYDCGAKQRQRERTVLKSKTNMIPHKYTTDMLLHLRVREEWE